MAPMRIDLAPASRMRTTFLSYSNVSSADGPKLRGKRVPGRMCDVSTTESELYYDPYDFEIDADPYPLWRRLREERPLYYNERYDFWALSRFDDVERALV